MREGARDIYGLSRLPRRSDRDDTDHAVRHRRLQRTLIAACGLGLAIAGSAGAATGTFVVKALSEPATAGLPVTGGLSDLVATSNARVMIPTGWRESRAAAGRLRFATTQNASCRYDLTYSVKSVLAPSQDASGYVLSKLPAASARHLLDSGTRGGGAFRVVRRPGIGARVRLDALWAHVLTRRSDIAANGNTPWTEIRVTAISRAGSECHSGTWREALGPAIGDSLAVARTRLHFTRKR